MDFLKKPVAIWVAVAIGVTSLIGTGLYITRSGDEDRAQPSAIRVEVAKTRRGSLVREMTVVGTLESANSVVMKAQVKGLVTKVNIIGGEDVQKGDILFEIDPRSYQARAKEAQALHDLAKAALEREEKLAERNFGAAKKLEEARAQFLKTQAQLESAQKDLEDTKIVAPFDGRVGLHRVSVGTPITADLDLVTITDTDPMKVNFKMPSKFVRYLSIDQKVTIEVDSYPNQQFTGRIEAIDALVDSGAQSIAVQATIPNPKNLLKPGMFVRVKVTVGSKDNSLIIPAEAIVAVGDQTYVWKVIEHPKQPGMYVVFRVEVLTGIQEKDRIEVTRNLREDDIVVTIGYQKVANGYPVAFDLESVDLAPQNDEDESNTDEGKEEDLAKSDDTPDELSPDQDTKGDKPSTWQKIKSFFSSESQDTPEPADAASETTESMTSPESSESEEEVTENADVDTDKEASSDSTPTEGAESGNGNPQNQDSSESTNPAPDSPKNANEADAKAVNEEAKATEGATTDSAKNSRTAKRKSLYAKTKKKPSNLQALLSRKSQ